MQIQPHQIQNVLRTYAHLDQLKAKQTEKTGDTEKKETHSDRVTISKESLARFNAQARQKQENDIQSES